MHQRIFAIVLAFFLIVVFAVLLRVADARAAGDNLVVTQDESSMERLIESNLITMHKLTVNEKFASADDLYLDLPMKGDAMPAYHITIDTEASHHNDLTHLITARAILLELHTNMKVPPQHRAAVLELLNNLNREKVFASAYIDSNTEIIFGWNLDVMSDGLPIEYVSDAVTQEDKLWKANYGELEQAF